MQCLQVLGGSDLPKLQSDEKFMSGVADRKDLRHYIMLHLQTLEVEAAKKLGR
jgi:hypothetical protein